MDMLKRLLATAVLGFLSAPLLAADYATCLLDKLPGVKNAPAHAAALPVHPSA